MLLEPDISKIIPLQISCVVFGISNVGKSSMLIRAAIGEFIENYDYLLEDVWRVQRQFEDKIIFIEFMDIIGQEEYEGLREHWQTYKGAQVLVICFSLVDPASFEYVTRKAHELRNRCRLQAPIVLVGTKSDIWSSEEEIERLRHEHRAPVSESQIKALSEEIGAASYLVCSAKEDEGVKEVVTSVIREFMKMQSMEDLEVEKVGRRKRKWRTKCVVM